jgi:CBS domain-containing protein
MRASGVRGFPVVDSQGSLTGILTSDDLLSVLLAEIGELVEFNRRKWWNETSVRTDG